MANLYANVAQVGGPRDLRACFDMVTTLPARLMNASDYGIASAIPPISSCSTAAMAPWLLPSWRNPCSA